MVSTAHWARPGPGAARSPSSTPGCRALTSRPDPPARWSPGCCRPTRRRRTPTQPARSGRASTAPPAPGRHRSPSRNRAPDPGRRARGRGQRHTGRGLGVAATHHGGLLHLGSHDGRDPAVRGRVGQSESLALRSRHRGHPPARGDQTRRHDDGGVDPVRHRADRDQPAGRRGRRRRSQRCGSKESAAAPRPMIRTRTLGAAGTWGSPITFVDAGVSGGVAAGAAGTVVTWLLSADPTDSYAASTVRASFRATAGAWAAPESVSETGRRVAVAEPAAGADGTLAVAWESRLPGTAGYYTSARTLAAIRPPGASWGASRCCRSRHRGPLPAPRGRTRRHDDGGVGVLRRRERPGRDPGPPGRVLAAAAGADPVGRLRVRPAARDGRRRHRRRDVQEPRATAPASRSGPPAARGGRRTSSRQRRRPGTNAASRSVAAPSRSCGPTATTPC